jgi:Tfp pilus assembly protein PilO
MAREFSVKISMIKPAEEGAFPLYTKYPFELTVEADNYHQIGKFISKIETNPNIYTVGSLAMHPQVNNQGNQPGKITASLKISTVLFKVK